MELKETLKRGPFSLLVLSEMSLSSLLRASFYLLYIDVAIRGMHDMWNGIL